MNDTVKVEEILHDLGCKKHPVHCESCYTHMAKLLIHIKWLAQVQPINSMDMEMDMKFRVIGLKESQKTRHEKKPHFSMEIHGKIHPWTFFGGYLYNLQQWKMFHCAARRS